jgi:2,4-dienoyl-CoA reductase-like NADH-dependent reductase (Old Yellow Enzyme family)
MCGGGPDIFAPATLGPVPLRNRTVKAATFEGRPTARSPTR